MGILESIRAGLAELASHKLRSFLTVLGVICGVAAVIAMVSIGEGAKSEALEQIRLMGIDVVHVKRQVLASDLLEKAEERSPYGLKLGDADNLKSVCDFARRVVSVREVFADVRFGGKPVTAKVIGTVPGYLAVSRSDVERGRFISEGDVRERRAVCVIGAYVKRELFGFGNPIGKTIRLGRSIFRVVGVMRVKEVGAGRTFAPIRDLNADVYIPITRSLGEFQVKSEQAIALSNAAIDAMRQKLRARQSIGNSPISEIIMQVANAEDTVAASFVIRSVLNRSHRGIIDYEIVIPAELLKQSQETQHIFNTVMLAIAGISLLVGGVGIMNIMLATVTQRTREIGIRRCVGANRFDIIRQFLLEALVITCAGGLIGIAVGIAGARAISVYADWRTIVSANAIVISFSVSVAVGVIFGMYPALRAAAVDPIEALRYE